MFKAAAYSACVSEKALDLQRHECQETYVAFSNCVRRNMKTIK